MSNFELVEPLIGETWVVDGKAASAPPGDTDALYIRPILQQRGAVPSGTKVLHSLVLDNNVFSDLVGSRRPANTDYLMNLLRSRPFELNPVLAMIEQRQGYKAASEALHDFAKLLGERFGEWDAMKNAGDFDQLLEVGKAELEQNMELLAGYLPAVLYIYHQSCDAKSKLEWLSGLIRESDLPFLQLPFYLGAFLFLTKENPALFRSKLLGKVRKDTKLMGSIDSQAKAVRNLAHDALLPAAALFPAGTEGTIVFPYIATRDYLLQDFISEIRCGHVVALPDGRANGAWELNPAGRICTQLGETVSRHLPRRTSPGSKEQQSVRRANLRAFSDSYLKLCAGQ
ncbi:hypothetical protein SOJ56_20965 [Pseudomonas aeruginosa]|uniref:hypothetical protein n=1 Tax=Pseudomonas aeruginosa TaxID=287 RepID=UPI002A6B1570|nr:hypothetical protein [Pseudomonas aeruginosa]MDY1261782.1 hypothetical protein [Pseudomonas aeruginosa]